VFADREKIIEVITNLLTNAIKFTEEGIIRVETIVDADSQMLRISVSDTGKGIDPEVMPRIFDKFVTKSDKGTGIGLYICKKIVEAHGGSISANNKAEGGAEIRVLLPLTQTSNVSTGE
jgi:signal transduction histidine kinase